MVESTAESSGPSLLSLSTTTNTNTTTNTTIPNRQRQQKRQKRQRKQQQQLSASKQGEGESTWWWKLLARLWWRPRVRHGLGLCLVLSRLGWLWWNNNNDDDGRNVASLLAVLPSASVAPNNATTTTTTTHPLPALLSSVGWSTWSDAETNRNAAVVQQQRHNFDRVCNQSNAHNASQQGHLQQLLWHFFEPPTTVVLQRVNKVDSFHFPCRFAFLDLGANVGDSLTKLVNVGLPKCPRLAVRSSRLELRDGRVYPFNKRNRIYNTLTKWTTGQLREYNQHHHNSTIINTQHLCYTGVEANPRFRTKLQALAQRVQSTHPRPLRQVQYLTSTAVSTTTHRQNVTFYLDQVSIRNNYWGSSLSPRAPEVQRSRQQQQQQQRQVKVSDNSASPAAQADESFSPHVHVPGIALSDLVRAAIGRNANDDDNITNNTNHSPPRLLLIKMDIEGSERAVLEELLQSKFGGLCWNSSSTSRYWISILVERHQHTDRYRAVQDEYDQFSSPTCRIRLQIRRDAG